MYITPYTSNSIVQYTLLQIPCTYSFSVTLFCAKAIYFYNAVVSNSITKPSGDDYSLWPKSYLPH